MYAPDGSKTYYFFPDKKRKALPDTTESVGKMKKDKVDARVQMARSARSVNFPKR